MLMIMLDGITTDLYLLMDQMENIVKGLEGKRLKYEELIS